MGMVTPEHRRRLIQHLLDAECATDPTISRPAHAVLLEIDRQEVYQAMGWLWPVWRAKEEPTAITEEQPRRKVGKKNGVKR